MEHTTTIQAYAAINLDVLVKIVVVVVVVVVVDEDVDVQKNSPGVIARALDLAVHATTSQKTLIG